MKHLVVISPFGGHEVGEAITDAGEIETVLSGEHAYHVVQAESAEPEKKEPAVIAPADSDEPVPEPETESTAPARGRKSKNRE